MFCSNCGKQVQEGARFCGSCGAPQNVPAKYYLYMDTKGLSLFNYKFDIRDGAGNLRYRAATVTESMIRCNARVYYPNDAEAMIIHQQKKLTMVGMNFDVLAPDGRLVTQVLQKIHFATSEFQLPELGIVVTGDFLSINFKFERAGVPICFVRKKVVAWGDCYELEFSDPSLEQVFLATVMVIQMAIATARRRR